MGLGLLAASGLALATPGGSRRARAWAVLVALVGLRLTLAVQGAGRDAAAWARAAAEGRAIDVRAAFRVERVRESRPGRWRVRGELAECPPPCAGAEATLDWREAPPPRPGERWRIAGRLAPDPLRLRAGARFPPPGLAPGVRRGAIVDARVEARGGRAVPLAGTVEAHLRERLAERLAGPPEGLVEALILGDRGGLDPDLADAFAATGTLHLLAVSGLHVGFLAATLGLALSAAGVGPRGRAAAATAALAGYAILVGARPSVLRASAMASAALWARAGERRSSVWQAWGVAAVALLAVRPLDLFDLGFSLSFGAVAGLLAVGGPWRTWLEGGSDDGPRTGHVGRTIASGLAATTAASVATLPVQAAAFGWVAPAGLLVNPVAVPLVATCLPLAWVALATDAVGLEPLAGPIATTAAAGFSILAGLVTHAAEGAPIWVPGTAGWGAGAAGALALGGALARRRPGASALAIAFGAALVLAARRPASPGWEVVWLDVGQGDAIALHFPDGATWLVDAGGADPFGDAGRRVVLPYLRRRGVRALAWLVTTHPDLDHVGGAASVVRGTRVERWGSAGPVSDAEAWLDLLTSRGPGGAPRARQLVAGQRLSQGGVAVDVLHPPLAWIAEDPYSSRVSENEASVVLLLSWRACRLLLTGDLGHPGETRLFETLGDSLRAGLLHVGHHGSRHSSTAGFLARVAPRDAVVSAGIRNRFGHPHPDALARLAGAGARVHRTDRVGSVIARCGPDGWQVHAGSP